jgi:hypothetical protein
MVNYNREAIEKISHTRSLRRRERTEKWNSSRDLSATTEYGCAERVSKSQGSEDEKEGTCSEHLRRVVVGISIRAMATVRNVRGNACVDTSTEPLPIRMRVPKRERERGIDAHRLTALYFSLRCSHKT